MRSPSSCLELGGVEAEAALLAERQRHRRRAREAHGRLVDREARIGVDHLVARATGREHREEEERLGAGRDDDVLGIDRDAARVGQRPRRPPRAGPGARPSGSSASRRHGSRRFPPRRRAAASRSRARRSRGGSRRGPLPRARAPGRGPRTPPRCRAVRRPAQWTASLRVSHRLDITSCLTAGMIAPNDRHATRNGRLAIIVAAAAWSTAGLAQRELDATPATQVAGRALFAFLALLVVVALTEDSGVIASRARARTGRRRRHLLPRPLLGNVPARAQLHVRRERPLPAGIGTRDGGAPRLGDPVGADLAPYLDRDAHGRGRRRRDGRSARSTPERWPSRCRS